MIKHLPVSDMLNACDHLGWLHLTYGDGFRLHYCNRLTKVIQEMTSPSTQYPSSMLFLGQKIKNSALRDLFPCNNFPRGRPDGIVNIRLDSSTISSELPFLIADGDPLRRLCYRLDTSECHQGSSSSIAWAVSTHQSFLDHIFARLVFLFSDVICIFADDFGGLETVASLLTAWVRIGSASSLPKPVRPRVVIVAHEEVDAATYSVLELESLRFNMEQEASGWRDGVFASITVIRLADDNLSSLARHRRLKEVLLREADISRNIRLQKRLLFSAVHIHRLFRQASQHTSRSVREPFDFLVGSRVDNPLTNDFQLHLSTFLDLSCKYYLSQESTASFVASSILVDAFPPRMHSKSTCEPNEKMPLR